MRRWVGPALAALGLIALVLWLGQPTRVPIAGTLLSYRPPGASDGPRRGHLRLELGRPMHLAVVAVDAHGGTSMLLPDPDLGRFDLPDPLPADQMVRIPPAPFDWPLDATDTVALVVVPFGGGRTPKTAAKVIADVAHDDASAVDHWRQTLDQRLGGARVFAVPR